MSGKKKSILILETPENCYDCGIRRGYTCGGVGGMHGKTLPQNLIKPKWCPMKEIPAKKEQIEYHGNGCFGINDALRSYFNKGFNSCIDEILKEKVKMMILTIHEILKEN